jgi:hypothetical protein
MAFHSFGGWKASLFGDHHTAQSSSPILLFGARLQSGQQSRQPGTLARQA